MTRKPDPVRDERIRRSLRYTANSTRDTADEIALQMGGVDDPLHPSNGPSLFRDWQDFVDRVARPIVEAEDAATPEESVVVEQAAMKLYRTANPYFICAAMVIMSNRIKRVEEADARAWPFGHPCVQCGQLAMHHPFRHATGNCDVWRGSDG